VRKRGPVCRRGSRKITWGREPNVVRAETKKNKTGGPHKTTGMQRWGGDNEGNGALQNTAEKIHQVNRTKKSRPEKGVKF